MHLTTVEQLNQLWRDLSARPLWRRPYTWKYIKLAYRMRLSLIKPHKVKLMLPRGKVNHCSECLDNCCIGKSSTVLLRLADIATLMDIGRTDLISHNKPCFSKDEQSERPALERNLRTKAWHDFPILKQTAYHACMALGDDGLCQLYPHWPLSCARFPYALHADDKVVFFSPRCPSYLVDASRLPHGQQMVKAACEAYNAQIKDAIMLAYIPEKLEALGVLDYLKHAE